MTRVEELHEVRTYMIGVGIVARCCYRNGHLAPG